MLSPRNIYIFFTIIFINTVTIKSKQYGSLTFVIDDTPSMRLEIETVKKATKSIYDAIRQTTSQINNVVLVTFNDPDTELPAFITRYNSDSKDEAKFSKALSPVKAHGGSDCPEPSMQGIQLGLTESRQNSYLFVFTDASPKDVHLKPKVISMAQASASQIFFFITVSADCRETITLYHPYYEIARATNGQVFALRNKDQISKILPIINIMASGESNVIKNIEIPANTLEIIPFTVDDQTEYVLVSTSGSDVQLGIAGPTYYLKDVISWENDVKSIKINNPPPGLYKASVKGSSVTTVTIIGRTDFTFQHGFSESVPPTFRIDKKQPTEGINHHLLVNVADPAHSVDIKTVEILSMDDKVLHSLPLHRVAGDYYKTNSFMPPSTTFKIRVLGEGKRTGKTIIRTAKTPIEPRLRELDPEIKIDGEGTYEYGSDINLVCKIKAHPKPTVSWKNDEGNVIEGTTTASINIYEYTSVLKINNLRKSSAYYCYAQNDRGQNSERVDVTIKSPFVVEDNPYTNINAEYGEPALISCNIKSKHQLKIVWFIYKGEKYYKIENSKEYTISSDGKNLKINKVIEDFDGKYACTAKIQADPNTIHALYKIIAINHLAPVMEENKTVQIKENQHTLITCSVIKAYPKPKITWQYRGLNGGAFETLKGFSDTISIKNASLQSSGIYKCIAENDKGKGEQETNLVVLVKPKVKLMVNNQERPAWTVNYNHDFWLECEVTSFPIPKVVWKDGRNNVMHTTESKTESLKYTSYLKISKIKRSQTYYCIASNEIGEEIKSIKFTVLDNAFQIHNSPGTGKVDAKYAGEAVLKCGIKSNFPMTITWTRQTGEPIVNSNKYIISGNGNELKIKEMDLGLQGKYICQAFINDDRENKISHSTEVRITGLETPEIEKKNGLVEIFRNDKTILKCKILKAHPKPKVTWFFKSEKNLVFKILNIIGDEITINKAKDEDAGYYKCLVSNVVGNDEHTIQLTVKGPPVISSEDDILYRAVEGDSTLRIPCVVAGYPKPTISWTTIEGPIVSGDKYVIKNEVLIIHHPKEDDSKNYTCTATNNLGTVKKTFEGQVTKNLQDEDLSDPTYIYMLVGETKALKCNSRNVTGRWFKVSRVDSEWEPHNVIGTLTLSNATDSNDGNYTCRISYNTGYKTQTYIVDVGYPPHFSDYNDFVEMNWDGSKDFLECATTLKPEIHTARFEWLYNGKPSNFSSGQTSDNIHPIVGWGNYSCTISNYHGSVTKNFKIYSRDCLMPADTEIKNSPLVLNNAPKTKSFTSTLSKAPLTWMGSQYRIKSGQSLLFSCHSPTNKNHFENLSNKIEIVATCDHEDVYKVDGKTYKISDLQCKSEVLPEVKKTGKKCSYENTELIEVGYNIEQPKSFLEVYSICFDNNKKRPLYSGTHMSIDNEVPVLESWRKYDTVFGDRIDNHCEKKSECCLGSKQLVNQLEVKHGPWQIATFIEGLNTVPFWHNCKSSSAFWDEIDKEARNKHQHKTFDTYVRTGTFGYSEKNGVAVPRYLWKMWRAAQFNPTIIVLINDPEPTEADKLCQTECASWVPTNHYNNTFCCSFFEFMKVFSNSTNF